LPRQELIALIGSLTEQMRSAADQLQFELAARLRDELKELKRELRGMDEAGT
jgi:excinuclease ABC subunit B